MSVTITQIHQAFARCGFRQTHTTKYVTEFHSRTTGQYIYVKNTVGLPHVVHVVTDPRLETKLRWAGVYKNSNLRRYPTKRFGGKTPIHNGSSHRFQTIDQLRDFLESQVSV